MFAFMLGVCLRGATCSFWVAFMAWIIENVLFHSVVYFSVHGQEQSKQMWTRLSCVGRGHLRRQFRWVSWWCKNWGSVQLLYSVISVHVFAILVYNEDRGWGKVFIWWFSIVMVLCFVFELIRFWNFFRGQLWVQIEESAWVWGGTRTFCCIIDYFVW